MLSITSIHQRLDVKFEKKQTEGKLMHFFIKSIFDYNSKKNPVNTPNDLTACRVFYFYLYSGLGCCFNKTSLHPHCLRITDILPMNSF